MESDGDLDARLRAALAASRELGADYDAAMVDSIRRLVVEHQLEAVPSGVATRPPPRVVPTHVVARPRRFGGHGFAGFSLVAAIPLSGIAGGIAHLPGLAVCWAGIVLVNLADQIGLRHGERNG